jgi:hypothetical protein
MENNFKPRYFLFYEEILFCRDFALLLEEVTSSGLMCYDKITLEVSEELAQLSDNNL